MNLFILFTLCAFFVPGASVVETDDVSLMKGDSVTLHTGVETNQQDRIRWYFNDTRIAQITGDQSKICIDELCKMRFRDRLKLDSHNGDLTITNINTTDSGIYKLQIFRRRVIQKIFNVAVRDVPGGETDKMKTKSVKEGESVTLNPGVIKNAEDVMTWYFNDILITEITRDRHKICEDVKCISTDERFRDRLKLDNQTGSLTIMNTRTTDSGLYKLQINSSIHPHHSIISIKRFSITASGASGVETDGVSAYTMEGNSVTLHTDDKVNHQDRIRWYFNKTRIAQITGDQSKICTDEQCKMRFRDRLKLDSHNGDLTITNINTTDSGVYKLQIFRRRVIQKLYNVVVHGVSAERDEVKRKSVKEGESVTLDPGVIKNPNHVMTWHFNDIHVAEITGDQRKICTDDQCDERFRDKLEINNQTGSLIITNTRSTHSGQYKVKIFHSISRHHRISIISVKTFSVTVIDSSLPFGLIAGICAAGVVALVLLVAVAVACLKHYCSRGYEHG